jgi:hypothetical protein
VFSWSHSSAAPEQHTAEFFSLSDIVTYMTVDQLQKLEHSLSTPMYTHENRALIRARIRSFLKHPSMNVAGSVKMQLFTKGPP